MKDEFLEKLDVIRSRIDIPECKTVLDVRLLKAAEDFLFTEYEACWQKLEAPSVASEYRAQLVSRLSNLRKQQGSSQA